MTKSPAKKTTTPRKPSGTTPKTRKTAPKPSVAKPAIADEPVGTSAAPSASKNILTAGIKALANAHGEAVARQSRVFGSLLGLGPNREASGAAGDKSSVAAVLDPFGFKKFEDVFDQRVARTLQRLDVPSAQAFADLTSEVERLRKELAQLKSQGRKR